MIVAAQKGLNLLQELSTFVATIVVFLRVFFLWKFLNIVVPLGSCEGLLFVVCGSSQKLQ